MLLFCGGEEGSGLWAGKVLLLFGITVRGSKESKEYTFLYYMKVTHLINMLDMILGCFCLRLSTDDEMDCISTRCKGISEQEGLSARERYRSARLKAPQGFVNVVRENHVVAILSKKHRGNCGVSI